MILFIFFSVKSKQKKRAVLSDSDASENETKESGQKRKHSATSGAESGSDHSDKKTSAKKKLKSLVDSDSDNGENEAEKPNNAGW